MNTFVKFTLGLLVGAGIGALVKEIKDRQFKETSEENLKATEETHDLDQNEKVEQVATFGESIETEVDVETAKQTEEETKNYKTGMHRTIEESIEFFKEQQNEEMLFILDKIKLYHKQTSLFTEDAFNNTCVFQLCWILTEANTNLMTEYHNQLLALDKQIKARANKTLNFITTNKNQDILYTVSFNQTHIKEAIARIDGPRIKYEKNTNSQKILVDEYARILLNLFIQHEDLKELGKVLPSRLNTSYNVNTIGKVIKGKAFNEFDEEMKKKLDYKQYKAIMVEDPERYFKNDVSKA